MRWPRLLAPPAIVAGSLVVLLSAVILGVSISGLRLFPPFGGRTQLGRSLHGTGIVPLTDRYVDQVLGPGAVSSEPRLARVGGLQRLGPVVPEDPSGTVDHPSPDDRADAHPVSALPFTGRTSTADASREPEEPECGPQHGGTVWYRYAATRTDSLLADTFGTGYQNTLAAFRESSDGLQQLEHGCDFDAQGNSQIKVDVTSGSSYLFQIGAAARGGALTFHLKRFGSTILASVSTAGKAGNAASVDPSVSDGGRYVAFASQATNLVPGMEARTCLRRASEEACYNVFLRDRQTGTTILVSVGLDGSAANDSSRNPQVSDDGRLVLFHSRASDLVAGDTNGVSDTFVRDMRTGRTERVSLSDQGEQRLRPAPVPSLAWSQARDFRSSMSADGRYVAFQSDSPNLVEGDGDEFFDVFVRDRLKGTTRVVSLDDGGKRSPLGVQLESMSRNGRWIVLSTDVPMSERDEDVSQDVFVRDLWTGATELVSVPEPEHELEGARDASGGSNSQRSISDDGRFVVFGFDGALVDGDTNGVMDVFVRDRLRQTTERVSVSSAGEEGTGTAIKNPLDVGGGNTGWSISGDGRTVAFTSDVNGLEPSDGNFQNDVFVHDRTHRVTLRVSRSGKSFDGSYDPRISGDGMHIAYSSWYPLSPRDSNYASDVFVFSPLSAVEEAVPVRQASMPAAPCPASSEYTRVGVAGVHEDVTPALIPAVPDEAVAQDHGYYKEHSVVRFKYRIDVSGSSTNPFARIADVGVELRWDDGMSDYDVYVYDARRELLAGTNGGPLNLNNGDLLNGDGYGIETELLAQVPHCTDLRVEVVNYFGLPPKEMTLDITLGGLS